MEISFDIGFSGFLFFVGLAFAIGMSFLVYFKHRENQDLSKKQRTILVILRFASVFSACLLLLSPILKSHKKIDEQPIILVGIDNSESVKPYLDKLKNSYADIYSALSDDFQVECWTFGQHSKKSTVIDGSEKSSDYSQLLKSLHDEYINKNIGGIILLGDGIYNRGQNPVNSIKSANYPIYSLAVGDTITEVDARIEQIRTNKVTYLGNRFPIEIDIKCLKLQGQIATLEVLNNDEPVYSQSIKILNDNYFKVIHTNIEAKKKGLQHYLVRIKPSAVETNLKNNSTEFVINVLQNKQRILAITDGPHPDLGAIGNTLKELKNYEFDLVQGNVPPDSIEKYNLLILNQIPSQTNTSLKLFEHLFSSRVPLLFIVGPQTFIPQLNSINQGLEINYKNNTEETQVRFNNDFSLFTLTSDSRELLESAPPLLAPYGSTNVSSDMYILANQTIKNIVTGNASIALGLRNGRKTGFIVGEGLWRWRLFDYQQTKGHEAFNEIIRKLIQYLASKENEDNFTVYHSLDYQETDHIVMTAELLNDSYELICDPDVFIRIWSDSLAEYNYTFDKTADHYHLDAGVFPSGDYHFTAKTKLGNKEYSESGDFSILSINRESQSRTANFSLLHQLSERSGGLFIPIEHTPDIIRSIKDNKLIQTKTYKQTNISEMINLKWIFGMVVLLFGLEWFLRKYWGIY